MRLKKEEADEFLKSIPILPDEKTVDSINLPDSLELSIIMKII